MDSGVVRVDRGVSENAFAVVQEILGFVDLDDVNNMNVIEYVAERNDVELLNVFLEHLGSGNHELGDVEYVHRILLMRGVDRAAEKVTVDVVKLHVELLEARSFLRGHVSLQESDEVHVAAILSGESDSAVLEALIMERLPTSGEELLSLLSASRGVPVSVLSGAL